jgi:signal transduction histidine kinase
MDTFHIGNIEDLYGQRPGELLDCAHSDETMGGCGTTEFCRTCGAIQAVLNSLGGKKSVQECRILRRDGQAFDLEVTATPLVLHGKKYSIFAIQDISHEKRRLMLERIFFHDLLNTAGSVIGYSELLKGTDPTHLNEMEFMIDNIFHHTMKMADEIKAQRMLLEAENDLLAVQPHLLHSTHLLHDILMLYQRHSASRERHIVIAPDAEGIEFTSDPNLLRRVLGNMLKNALEASFPGETVTLNCTVVGDEVEFSAHNSAYIPRQVQLQLFQRSFSTKSSDRGLGTYSMKLLTERYLKGSISFVTSQDEGTTFKARYPLQFPA